MKYIEVDNQTGQVLLIHSMPFDKENGLGKTEEELKQSGFLVTGIPEPNTIENKNPILYYDGTFRYEYESRPLSESERLGQVEQTLASFMLGGL